MLEVAAWKEDEERVVMIREVWNRPIESSSFKDMWVCEVEFTDGEEVLLYHDRPFNVAANDILIVVPHVTYGDSFKIVE